MKILFDIGGTKMRIGRSDDGSNLGTVNIEHTPREYIDGFSLLVEKIKELSGGERIDAIGGGIAGPFSQETKSLLTSPNLKGWIGKPLRADLEKEFGCPVYIENDAALVGLGEAIYGAGKGSFIVAFMTVSTGVGGARIVNGKIDEHAIGFEPGHQIIDADQSMCPECSGATLESYISAKSLEYRLGEKAYFLEDKKLWDTLARYLSYGLHNMAVFWSPDVIVLGGPMIVGKPCIPLEKIKQYLEIVLKIYPKSPEIKMATLGDKGGLYGALEYIKQQTNMAA